MRSAQASGPFTGAGLKAVGCLLRAGLLDPDEEEREGGAGGMDPQAEYRRYVDEYDGRHESVVIVIIMLTAPPS